MSDDKCPGCGKPLDDIESSMRERPTYECESYHTPNEPPEFCESWTCLRNQIARLQAIVGNLPKTEDGVPINHMMTVFILGVGQQIYPLTFYLRDQFGERPEVKARPFYSTRKAAEAAKENESGQKRHTNGEA